MVLMACQWKLPKYKIDSLYENQFTIIYAFMEIAVQFVGK